MVLRNYTDRKSEILPLLPRMFEIISRNMHEIAPTGNDLEEDRAAWTRAMHEELQNPDKRWILLFSGDKLAGYTLYRITGETLYMDEIQLAKEFHGDGMAFPMLMGKLLRDAKEAGVRTLHSYVNRQNAKSRGIVQAMGLRQVQEKPRGYVYQGRAEDAYAWSVETHGSASP